MEVGVLDVWSRLFTPQGRTGVGGFCLDYVALCQGRGCAVYDQSVSPLFLPVSVWIFSQLVGNSQLVSGFFSEGIDACIFVYSVHPFLGGGRFRSLLFCLLVAIIPQILFKDTTFAKNYCV